MEVKAKTKSRRNIIRKNMENRIIQGIQGISKDQSSNLFC